MNNNWELTPEKFLTPIELSSMIAKADELFVLGQTRKRKGLVRDSFLIHTAIFTGLRNSEMCDLKVSDLRIGNGQSHLIVRQGKGGKQRVVHIGKDYKRILKRFLQWKMDVGELNPDAYLLKTERSPRYCVSALWRRWKKYCPKTLHSARHTNATLVFKASGNNLRMVQKQLGHSRITTTQIYADVMPDVMRESMTAMERLARSLHRRAETAAEAIA
jgi:integrase/recombinase XerD